MDVITNYLDLNKLSALPLRYIDTRPNGDALRKCILEGPCTPYTVIISAVPATKNSPAVPERTTVETILNMSPENKTHFESEKEAIHLLLIGIGDEIYSTVDACKSAHEIWEAIERLQQGESLNVHDVKTKLFREFGKFTSHDGETMESYYTRHKGKEIAKPITPPSESAFEKDSDPEQAQKDKEMQKNLALIAKYFKKLYKPTNNNLRTSSNTRNKNVDTTLRYKNDNQNGQFRNQRIVNVAGARETVNSQVVQQTRIQCFNCKEFGHFAKECRKPKRVKDSTYHKEKMLMCKQAEKRVPLKAEQSD
ncbi:retrovirus-related pol polyprotein from transposon TNT 1-94 [Tanacetum coccineum]